MCVPETAHRPGQLKALKGVGGLGPGAGVEVRVGFIADVACELCGNYYAD